METLNLNTEMLFVRFSLEEDLNLSNTIKRSKENLEYSVSLLKLNDWYNDSSISLRQLLNEIKRS